MARLDILIYPNPTLRRKSSVVTDFNEEIRKLAHDMVETMYSGGGVGLAAPQVGVNIRLLVLDVEQTEKGKQGVPHIIINPEIVSYDGEIEWTEGCLSLPGLNVKQNRKNNLILSYQDEAGKKHKLKASGLFAVVIQHEMDHLDGRLLVDYITEVQEDMYLKELKKICQQK